jgi:hypothetical protein
MVEEPSSLHDDGRVHYPGADLIDRGGGVAAGLRDCNGVYELSVLIYGRARVSSSLNYAGIVSHTGLINRHRRAANSYDRLDVYRVTLIDCLSVRVCRRERNTAGKKEKQSAHRSFSGETRCDIILGVAGYWASRACPNSRAH